jgi:hypothetical protein
MRDIATASDIERVIVTSLEEILVIIEDLDRCVTCDVRGQGHAKGAPSLGPFLTGSTSSVAPPGSVKIKGRVEIDPLRVARENNPDAADPTEWSDRDRRTSRVAFDAPTAALRPGSRQPPDPANTERAGPTRLYRCGSPTARGWTFRRDWLAPSSGWPGGSKRLRLHQLPAEHKDRFHHVKRAPARETPMRVEHGTQ